YPRMYWRLIQPGERFLYYRGRKKRSGGRALQVYFGSAVVGAIRNDPKDSNRFHCEVLDYRPFSKPVPFKDPSGRYLERKGGQKGYYRRGVRRISKSEFQKILALALL